MDTKTRGRLIALVMSLALVFAVMPMMAPPAYADSIDITSGGINYTLNSDDFTASVAGSDEQLAEVVIPATVEYMGDKYAVISIEAWAFESCSNLEKVDFAEESKLKRIETVAFRRSGLKKITVPNSLTFIGANAFNDCQNLHYIHFRGTKADWDQMERQNQWDGGKGIQTVFVKEPPEGKTLTYNGNEQTGVSGSEGYTLSGMPAATATGSYQATATLAETYEWSDGTTDPKTIEWRINKAAVKVAVPSGKTFTYDGKEKAGVEEGEGYTLTGATATNAGSYTATAKLKDDPNYAYEWKDRTTGAKTITWKINKANNPLMVKAKTVAVKFSKLKKKNQLLAVGKVIKFTKNGQGKTTYALVSAKKGSKSFKKKFTVNKTTGKVKVIKGLKKGKYRLKIKVSSAGNGNFNKATKTVTVTINVR